AGRSERLRTEVSDDLEHLPADQHAAHRIPVVRGEALQRSAAEVAATQRERQSYRSEVAGQVRHASAVVPNDQMHMAASDTRQLGRVERAPVKREVGRLQLAGRGNAMPPDGSRTLRPEPASVLCVGELAQPPTSSARAASTTARLSTPLLRRGAAPRSSEATF